ncbi:MAG: N-acetyltransferase family protein, partial [Bradymonadaceae bacterium]
DQQRDWGSYILYRDDLPDELLDGLSVAGREMQWDDILENPEPRSSVFVAERDDKLVGFAHCGACRDEDIQEFDVAEIFALYVDPQRWREGIGSELLRRCVDFLGDEDYDFMALWVLTTNQQARD